MQHRSRKIDLLLIVLCALIKQSACESASNTTESEKEVAPVKLSAYNSMYNTGYNTGMHGHTHVPKAGYAQPNTYTTQDSSHIVYPQTHKTVPATLTYPEQTVQVNQRLTNNVVEHPRTASSTKHVPHGQQTYTRTDQAQHLSTTDQLITQTTNPFQTKTIIGTPVTETTSIDQPISDSTVTTRNFPNEYYKPDPNAPDPYYDAGIYNLPNYEHVPNSFAVGQNQYAPGVPLSKGHTQNPGTYVNYPNGNPSVTATGYGHGGYGYGQGGYGYGNAYTPGYSNYGAYNNGLFLKEQNEGGKSGKLSTGALVGIIAGGVCFLGLCVGGVCCMMRNNKYQGDNGETEMNQVDVSADQLPNVTHDTEVYSQKNQSMSMHSIQDESTYGQAQPKEQQL